MGKRTNIQESAEAAKSINRTKATNEAAEAAKSRKATEEAKAESTSKAKSKEISVNKEALMKRMTEEERKMFRRVKWKQLKDLPEDQSLELDKRLEYRKEHLKGQLKRVRAFLYSMCVIIPLILWGFGDSDRATMIYFVYAVMTCMFMTACTGIRISVLLRPIFWVIQFPVIRYLGALLYGCVSGIRNGSMDNIIEDVASQLAVDYGITGSYSLMIIVLGIISSLLAGIVNNPNKIMARQEYARMLCARGAGGKKNIDPGALPKPKKKGYFARKREEKENKAALERHYEKVKKSVKRNSNFTFYAFWIAIVTSFVIAEFVKNPEYNISSYCTGFIFMSLAVMLVLGYRAAYHVSFGNAILVTLRNGIGLLIGMFILLSVDPEMGGINNLINMPQSVFETLIALPLFWIVPTLLGAVIAVVWKKIEGNIEERKKEKQKAAKPVAKAKEVKA